jgi:hypothetical protein
MTEQASSGPLRAGELSSAERLDSWKEIAAYLKRGVTTVQRWEHHEGLPVHRHQHDKRGSVYAFKSELDAWFQQGRQRLEFKDADSNSHPRSWSLGLRVALVAAILVAVAGWIITVRSTESAVRAVGPSTLQLSLIDELQHGPGPAVAISPDGRHRSTLPPAAQQARFSSDPAHRTSTGAVLFARWQVGGLLR